MYKYTLNRQRDNEISLQYKTMPELIIYLNDVLEVNAKENKNRVGVNWAPPLYVKDSEEIVTFLKYFNECRENISMNNFTDGFESAIKLKLYVEKIRDIDMLLGDDNLGSILKQMCLVLTRRFFDVLEGIENKLKLENGISITKLLD